MRWSAASLVVLAVGCGHPTWQNLESHTEGAFGDPSWIDETALRSSIALAAEHLVRQQKPDGLFRYEYDVSTGKESTSDNIVRQMGSYWSLGLLLSSPEAHLTPALRQRVETAFDRMTDWIVARRRPLEHHPGAATIALAENIETGAIALCALGLIERVRAGDRRHEALLRELLAYLVAARHPDGTFSESYRLRRGSFSKRSNPYADGEALLALATDHHVLGDRTWQDALDRSCKGLRKRWVASTREDDRKGFYQWGTMAFWQYAQSHPGPRRRFEDTILSYADWMVLEHDTLTRTRNTSYAIEGLATAFAVARARHDTIRTRGLRYTILKSHARLISAQIGHRLNRKNPFMALIPRQHLSEERTRGGFLNGHEDSSLRIDVTQHAVHAMLMTLEVGVLPE